MKELHLICNAHLDPVWQWDWDAGITAALATFYSAAELAEEYDYIFCHNEAFLYECIEEYDPALFDRIKQLVKAGKWHIMGGWYIQPDCNLPSGEGFVRQIESGRKYFKEKFGVTPRVAVNFDSFGHTRGLVQILKKCGYEGYIFCRPLVWMMDLPAKVINWVGFDDSTVKASRFVDDSIYCSGFGNAVNDIKRKMKYWDEDLTFALWGIGNHGGGPSRKDLREIGEFIEEQAKNGVKVLHSTPEAFFDKTTARADFDKAMQPCFVKCYSSISRLKKKYVELENALVKTEKICAYADSMGVYSYDYSVFADAQKNLAAIQFHDVLSGTCIEEGEKSSLRKADYALELLDKQFNKAFMALCGGYKKAKAGDYPIFVFNPNLSEEEVVFNGDFFLLDGIVSDVEGYDFIIKKDGKEVPFQIIKESSRINMDRSKRVAIKSKLNPLSITRFDVEVLRGKKQVIDRTPITEFSGKDVKFGIDLKGGLNSFVKKGEELLDGNAFVPVMFDDNADPWGWHMNKLGENSVKPNLSKEFRIVEKGDLLTTVEGYYDTDKSEIRIAYTFYKDYNFVDITVNVNWNDAGKGLKLEIPFKKHGRFIGQTAFGTQEYSVGTEECSQRFVGVENGGKVLAVFKDGTFGSSVEGSSLYLTLLNGSVYCAHPVDKLPIIDDKEYNKYIDIGRHDFSFRLEFCNENELENKANEFMQKPYSVNFYPHGKGVEAKTSPIKLSNNNISLVAFRKVEDCSFMVRLINNYKVGTKCECCVFGSKLSLDFGKYEVKTLIYKDGVLSENPSMLSL